MPCSEFILQPALCIVDVYNGGDECKIPMQTESQSKINSWHVIIDSRLIL